MGTVDSDRRLNLSFDDLDLDILEWLNSFGKRKRARVAKEALRKAMNEGFRDSPNKPRPILEVKESEQKSPKDLKIRSEPLRGKSIKPTSNSPNVLDTLINLTGVENDLEILSFLDQGKNEGAIP